MVKEFIPYEEALMLKELGYDGESICFYQNGRLKTVDQHWGSSISGISKQLGYKVDDLVLAPLYQQAFRWFDEEKGLNHYNIRRDFGISTDGVMDYYEIELECLRKLIKLV